MENWTVRSLLQWAREWLGRKGVENPRLDAELLLAHALGCDRTRLYVDFDKPLGADELRRFKPLLQRRGTREPVAYILGVKEFYGRPFAVRKGVFIPRPETELLVQLALEAKPGRALDLCAGSGIVGISLAAERPETRVDLIELSPESAAVARENAERLAPGRVRVLEGDLFAALPEEFRYDAITANPPYIAANETLSPDIVEHEPHLALFGGQDGLDVIRRIVVEVPRWLAPAAFFAMEIDPPQRETVEELCREAGLREVRCVRDLAGLERHVVARGA